MKKQLLILLTLILVLTLAGCQLFNREAPVDAEEKARVEALNKEFSNNALEYNYNGPNIGTPEGNLNTKE